MCQMVAQPEIMSQLAPVIASRAPALVAAAGPRASYRFLEFFTAQIRNPHTRRASRAKRGLGFNKYEFRHGTQPDTKSTIMQI
jgi:hypothetical protein